MNDEVDMLKDICEHCRHFCPSQIYNNFGYCRLHNGRKGKHLFLALREACKDFSSR